MTKPHPISIAAIGACIALISSAWLYMIVSDEIGGDRREYQTIVPFIIGFTVAVPIAIWPVRRWFIGWKRLVARSVLFTLLLAPVPYGPEGTLLPLIVTLIFPPLVFIFLFPGRIALSFFSFLGFFSVLDGIKGLVFPASRGERSST